MPRIETKFLPAPRYALDETLASGQAFRWRREGAAWEGVAAGRWVRLEQKPDGIAAAAVAPGPDWTWLEDYLQTRVSIEEVVRTFPQDEHMNAAVRSAFGLRLLKQEPWECLASFILSSTKQIVQIQQIVRELCERFGDLIPAPPDRGPQRGFPSAARLSQVSEAELRQCKMGFRAPYLLGAARMAASGKLDLESLRGMGSARAREQLLEAPGVGRKIADCVLLFAYGFQDAFPVDVWVLKAIKQLYFPRKRPNRKRIEKFTLDYFGPFAGYAQQYLFHYMRTKIGRTGINPKPKS